MNEIKKPEALPDEVLRELMLDEQSGNQAYRRDRGLYDYEAFLGINIFDLAVQSLDTRGSFCWWDMCCGQFEAGSSFARSARGVLNTGRIEIRGIDIDTENEGDIVSTDGVVISRGNVVTYPVPEDRVDLITCINGLYLIDKHMGFGSVLQALENWYAGLSINGLLVVQNDAILTGYGQPLHVLDHLLRWAKETGNTVKYEHGREGRRYDDYRYIKITKTTASQLSFPAINENDPPVIPVNPDPDIDNWWSKFS